MNCAVISGFGGTGRSENPILTDVGTETATGDFVCFETADWSVEGLQPTLNSARLGRCNWHTMRIIIFFTHAKLLERRVEFFEPGQGNGGFAGFKRGGISRGEGSVNRLL